MKIAILPPLKRPIIPTTTVSRNRVIANLSLGLVKKNHHVTIFGTEDSSLPDVVFHGVMDKGYVDLGPFENPFYAETAYIVHAIREIVKMQDEFDLIHNHMYPEFLPLLCKAEFKIPVATTVHSQITDELKMALSDTQGDSQLIVLSESAKKMLGLPAEVIYNGIDAEFFQPLEESRRDYLLFIGRMSRAKNQQGEFVDPKGVAHAIALAQKTGERLKIVGNVEDEEFYKKIIQPHISDKIEFVGEVSPEQNLSREEVRSLYQNAKALISPINWDEPFGLVYIEAMSCGTPVVAYDRGAVSEILIDNSTGFVIDPEEGTRGLIEGVQKLNNLSKDQYREMIGNCRKRVLEKFTVEKMIEEYEKLYMKISSA